MKISQMFLVWFFALLSTGNINARETETIQTHKLEVLLNGTDPNAFSYILNTGCLVGNTGCCFITDFFAPRNYGSYNYVRGQIYKGGTISKKQKDYTVDKHGHALTADNSLGMWRCFGQADHDFDWFNMPTQSILFEIADWDFFFKDNCYGKQNSLYTRGAVNTGTFNPAKHKVAVFGTFVVDNGSGCNEGAHGNITIKLYISPSYLTKPAVLIKLKFDEPITIAV